MDAASFERPGLPESIGIQLANKAEEVGGFEAVQTQKLLFYEFLLDDDPVTFGVPGDGVNIAVVD